MPREYRHIQQYEKEILRLREEGLTYREIGEKLGFSKKQIKEFFGRLHAKERKLAVGTPLRKKRQTAKRLRCQRRRQSFRTALYNRTKRQ